MRRHENSFTSKLQTQNKYLLCILKSGKCLTIILSYYSFIEQHGVVDLFKRTSNTPTRAPPPVPPSANNSGPPPPVPTRTPSIPNANYPGSNKPPPPPPPPSRPVPPPPPAATYPGGSAAGPPPPPVRTTSSAIPNSPNQHHHHPV